jgi:UDP-galactopyranose mutase
LLCPFAIAYMPQASDAPAIDTAAPYRSFWMAGFEGADHRNAHGIPLDLVHATGHLERVDEDYRRVAALGFGAIRESVGWRLCEPNGATGSGGARFDFSRALRFAEAANRHGLQLLWTLMHYGRPADVDLFEDDFADRFADFAGAAARALRGSGAGPAIYTPINEISFLAWAISETHLIHPYRRETDARQGEGGSHRDIGWEAKWRLVRAALRGIEAIRAEDPHARFLHVEPLIHIAPPRHQPGLAWRADEIAEYQWQTWDMLDGKLLPELGGSARALDLIGVNYYHNCQWEMGAGWLEWCLDDPRRVTLSSLLRKVALRYRRPLIVAETSHIGSGRARWMQDIATEIEHARSAGVPVLGVCIYPVIDRPDWNDDRHWHHSGLWDVAVDAQSPGHLQRKLHAGYARRLRRAQQRLPHLPISDRAMPHLIVFSHLRWEFVFQRPQHLLSRLARHFHVVFVEEPMHTSGPAYLERTTPCKGVEVLRAHTPVEAGGFHDDQLSALQPMIGSYLAEHLIDDYVVWFYTPMALPLLGDLHPRAIVYDCMDELSAFKHAPRQMRQRETALLKSADLVVTGGPRLYEAKREANDNVLCLPSAVDAKHYAPRRATADAAAMERAAALQGRIGTPRLGFFGVIDERLDLDLVARVADADRRWQVVMVGPIAKIDEAALPQRANLHWLGQQPYALLPQLVAGWDVCLMPFALNESTEFISPTKTLEYMAAGKPVVSTPIHDVEAMFGDIVAIAASADAFVAACRAALAETSAQKREREARMKAVVAQHSWDGAAEKIRESLHAVLAAAPRASAPARGSAASGAVRTRVSPVASGAGAGLDPTPVASTRKGVRKVASAG